MFCPICRSFIDSSKNHCSACGTIVDLNSISKSKKQKNKNSNVSSKRKLKKQNKRVKAKSKPKAKKSGKKKSKRKKAKKPSAKHAMLEDVRNYISKNPNKKKKSKKRNRQKNKNSVPNGKSKKKRAKKIKPTKTNTTIKSKTGRIEYNNGYAVIEGASWNGKRMKKGSFKKRFNGENHGFQVSTWALGGVGRNFKNKY